MRDTTFFSLAFLVGVFVGGVAFGAPANDIHVRDGDTIVVDGQPWRLSGVNCPENGTQAGAEATALLGLVLRDAYSISCDWDGGTTYDRKTGYCSVTLPNVGPGAWLDIGAIMIGSGACGRCDRYDPEGLYVDVQLQGGYSGPVPGYCQ
jgi:endonuclease YncB( thermonuclease family)